MDSTPKPLKAALEAIRDMASNALIQMAPPQTDNPLRPLAQVRDNRARPGIHLGPRRDWHSVLAARFQKRIANDRFGMGRHLPTGHRLPGSPCEWPPTDPCKLKRLALDKLA